MPKKRNKFAPRNEHSGRTYTPACEYGCKCGDCGAALHREGEDSHYCPRCDDFALKDKGCPHG